MLSSLLLPLLLLSQRCLALSSITTPAPNNNNNSNKRIVVLGGSGRIGTAVAIHLLNRDPTVDVVLTGRRTDKGDAAVREVLEGTAEAKNSDRVSFVPLRTVWDGSSRELRDLVDSADAVVHAAGPYLNRAPTPLRAAVRSKRCRAYVDVSDPLDYLEASLSLRREAEDSGTTALLAAGAFPGMSNVLAKEATGALSSSSSSNDEGAEVKDVRFHYFTAGLGGSGDVNLYITNLGFGEPMVQHDRGERRSFAALSGSILGRVNFFLPGLRDHPGNESARRRVGTKTIFAWPFPEAATVARDLRARGNSYAGMGTAPDVWNVMLGVLVRLVPRRLWREERFSKFVADFSKPLVSLTDAWLRENGTGETHAMRIDVTSADDERSASIVQAHDSFRRCVGQSCAEFALDALSNPKPGVYLPEQFYDRPKDRTRILEKLSTTPGTFCYTGPVLSDNPPELPSKWQKALLEANEKESALKG